MKSIGVLGGTFDPVHLGHLRTALEVFIHLGLDEMRFIPCRLPPHRAPPVAPGELRLAMVRAAIAGQPGFVADDRELRRPGPSYMVDTLASLRAEHPAAALLLVLGRDAFEGLPRWHRWREILSLAHVVVMGRPGWDAPLASPLQELAETAAVAAPAALLREPAGRILFCEVTRLEISSSAIRSLLARGEEVRYLVPEVVRDLLLGSGCYGSDSVARGGQSEVG